MDKILPRNVTSYDLLKTFAVVTMIIDHIGFYFFPDALWFRAIGRLSFPVWFFLVGYANTRDVPLKFWVGGAFLVFMNVVTGLGVLPLNILFAVAFVRFAIDNVMFVAKAARSYLWSLFILCALLFLPTNNLFEYGTLALLFGMFGYMVRHKGEAIFTSSVIQPFMIAIVFIYAAFQWAMFIFDAEQFIVMTAGAAILCIIMSGFRPMEYVGMTAKLPPALVSFFQFCGRRTLEIYVAHLTLFKVAALCLGDERFELFRMKLFIW